MNLDSVASDVATKVSTRFIHVPGMADVISKAVRSAGNGSLSVVAIAVESEVESQFFDNVTRPVMAADIVDLSREVWAGGTGMGNKVSSALTSLTDRVHDAVLDMIPVAVNSKGSLAAIIESIQYTNYEVFKEVDYDNAVKRVSAECYRHVQDSLQSVFNAVEAAVEAIGNVKLTCSPDLLYLQDVLDVEAGEDMFGLSKHRVMEGVYDATHLPVDEVFSSVESTLDRIIATGTVESQVSFIKLMYLQDQVSNRASSDMRLSVRNLTAASVLFPVAEPINPLRSSIEASLGIEE